MKSYLFPGTSLPMVIEASSSEYSSFDNLCAFVSKHSTELFSNLYRYGAILFRGFAVTEVTQFETFAKLSVPKLTTYRGGDSPRHRVNRYIYTSTEFPAEYPIPLHNELSYSRRYPRLIFFFCYTPVARGGRTPLLDGRKLYKLLDSRIIETFARKKLKYVQNLHAGIGFGKSWQDTFETDDREVVERHLREVGAIAEWKSSGGLRVEEIVSPIIKHPVTGEKVFFHKPISGTLPALMRRQELDCWSL